MCRAGDAVEGGGGGRRGEVVQSGCRFFLLILYQFFSSSLLHEKLCGCRVDAGAQREYTGGRSRDAGGTQEGRRGDVGGTQGQTQVGGLRRDAGGTRRVSSHLYR